MLKVVSLNNIKNNYTGEFHFIKNGVYTAEVSLEYVGRGKYAYYYIIHKLDKHETWRYTHDDFCRNFIPLNESRKLKLEKLQNIQK